MDHLSKALADTHLRGSLLAMLDFAAPWSVDFETAHSGAPTHYIVSGEAWLDRMGEPPLRLVPGDLVMFPRWDRHILSCTPKTEGTLTIREVVARSKGVRWTPGEWLDHPLSISIPGDGPRTTLLSLVFELDENTPHPLLLALPRLIHLSAADTQIGPWLQQLMQFLIAEAESQRGGYAVVSSRIADLLFMQIVRSELLTRPEQVAGWLRALVDPAIGTALAAMHDRPGERWTLPALARISGLSRSGFCARFRELMDVTPHQHLQRLRMEAAAARLSAGARVKSLADEFGYATPFSFNLAFKRHFGMTPSAYRNRHQLLEM